MIPEPQVAKAVVEKSSKVFTEFQAFISRGNVVDLAVGVIIGAAFGKIVTALVNDIIMLLINVERVRGIEPSFALMGVQENSK